jgi:hypothetical protein
MQLDFQLAYVLYLHISNGVEVLFSYLGFKRLNSPQKAYKTFCSYSSQRVNLKM